MLGRGRVQAKGTLAWGLPVVRFVFVLYWTNTQHLFPGAVLSAFHIFFLTWKLSDWSLFPKQNMVRTPHGFPTNTLICYRGSAAVMLSSNGRTRPCNYLAVFIKTWATLLESPSQSLILCPLKILKSLKALRPTHVSSRGARHSRCPSL